MNLLSEHNRILRVGEGGTEVYLPGDNINITDHVISGKYWDNEINSAISSTSGYIVNEAFNQSTAWNEGQGYLTAHQDVSNLPYVQNSALDYNGNLVSSISGKGLFAESANNSYHADSATSAGFVESANFANSALNSKSANFANSAWRAVFVDGGWEHDSSGNITAYNNSAFVGSTNGGKYQGVLPIVVNNEEMKISAKSASLGVQEPLYLVEDSESATVIGIDNGAFPTFEGTTDGKISAINGSAIYTTNTVTAVESAVSASILTTSAGWDVIEYSAGANISIQNHIVSGKDWTSEIQAASSYAYDQSTGTIPDVTNLPYVQNTALHVDGGNNLTAISSYSVGHPQVTVSGESGVYLTKRDGTVYIGYSGAGGGQGVDYTGIAPIVVNNVEHKISAQSAILGVQEPLYFVEDSESATVIGFSGSSNFPESADQACKLVTANSANWGDIPTKVVTYSSLATGSNILYIVTGA